MSSKYDNILIGGNQVGLERDLEPWLLPHGAYPILENAFIRRERVKRKRGMQFFGRLRRVLTAQALGNTDGAGAFSGNIITILGLETTAEIQPGSITITVAGAPAETFTEPATPDGTLVGDILGTGTINYATGALTLTGTNAAQAVTIDFSYFPTLPVMGIRTKENPLLVNQESTIGFDTKYAYQISGGQWVELNPGTTWNGADYKFFWTTNYYLTTAATQVLYFFATNFNYNPLGTSDPIRYYDNTNWNDFTPILEGYMSGPPPTGSLYLLQARVIIPYKGRLLVFNTVEGDMDDFTGTNYQYPQRCRWSAPLVDPITSTSWQSDVPGYGNFIDAPTGEAIVSVVFLKDNLVVYFERSTWLLDYTGDQTTPFVFKKINTELGAEGTFSTWAFDDYAVGVGDVGFHICNGYGTERFDNPIPDEIFKFQNTNNGPDRIYAVRDWYNELIYFTYPQEDIYDDGNDDQKFPNRVMIYNYRNNSWAKFTDSFTCYGYYQRSSSVTWASATWSWAEATWSWQGDIETAFIPIVMAGNQQGFTLIQQDRTSNEKTLSIQNIVTSTITCQNHNLKKKDFIVIEDFIGGNFDPNDPAVFQVQTIIDSNTFTINGTFTGTYLGNGVITVLQNFRIATKRFNPYIKIRNTVRLGEINFFLDKTDNGEFEVRLLIDENTSIPMPTFSPFDKSRRENLPANRQSNIVLTRPETGMSFQANQEKIWHPKRFTSDAQFIQLTMTLSDSQMQDLNIYRSDFVLHAILMKVSPSGRLVL